MNFGQIPAYIEHGEYKGKGFSDNIIRMIHRVALPGLYPKYLKVNHKRFNVEAKNENNCYVGWKTFSKYRYFSDPVMIFFPSGVIVHKKDRNLFGKEGTLLSLKELLKNNALKLGVIDAFAYSPEIQKVLSGYKDKPNVYFSKAGNMQVDLRMLTSNRIDYLIGWPTQPIVSEKLSQIPNDFIFYNMEEDQNYLYIGVSCGRGETGKMIIEKTNTLFARKDIQAEVLSYLKEWVLLSKQYEELYNDTIINHNENPLVVHMVYPEQ